MARLFPIGRDAAHAVGVFVCFLTAAAIIGYHFTTSPRPWIDEGIFIQLGRTLVETGKMQLPIAPGTFSAQPYLYSVSTSYPVVLPVGLFLKMFGVGIAQARAVMALYLIGTLVCAYAVARRLYERPVALATLGAIALFPPLYGNGKPVQGEVPAFFWFLLACLLFMKAADVLQLRRQSGWRSAGQMALVGVCLGLAAASKIPFTPFALGCVATFAIFAWKHPSLRRTDILGMAAGVAAPLALWPVLALPELSVASLADVGRVITNFVGGARRYDWLDPDVFFRDTTLLYFAALSLLVLAVGLWRGAAVLRRATLGQAYVLSCLWLGFFWFLYWFAKSPGWLRYLLPFQLVVLLLLPFALEELRAPMRRMSSWLRPQVLILVMVALHGIRLAAGMDDLSGDAVPRFLRAYGDGTFGQPRTIGVIQKPQVAAFLPFEGLTQSVDILRPDGVDPVPSCPDLLVVAGEEFEARGLHERYEVVWRSGAEGGWIAARPTAACKN